MNLSAISNALRRHAHWGLAIGALVCAPSASQARSSGTSVKAAKARSGAAFTTTSRRIGSSTRGS